MAKKAAAPAGNAGSSAFGSKLKKFSGDWKKAREAKANSFEQVIVEPGDYITKLASTRVGVTNNGNGDPYISLNFQISQGPEKGKFLNIMRVMRAERDLEFLAKDFQRLGYDTVEMELGDIEEIAKDLDKEKPFVKLMAKEPQERKDGDGVFQAIYIQKVLTDAEAGGDGEVKAKPKAKR